MERKLPTEQELERFVRAGEYMLKRFHEEEAQRPGNPEAEYWRGHIKGFREGVRASYGNDEAVEIVLDRLRKNFNLPIPPAGLREPDGSIIGWDSEADLTV